MSDMNSDSSWVEIEFTNSVDAEIRCKKAVELLFRYGDIDGEHHKMWTIDQAVRILAGNDYERLVAEANDGEDGPDTYEWDTGIAP